MSEPKPTPRSGSRISVQIDCGCFLLLVILAAVLGYWLLFR